MNIHVILFEGTNRNLTGLPSLLFNLFRHLVVAHINGRVEWSEHDPTSVDSKVWSDVAGSFRCGVVATQCYQGGHCFSGPKAFKGDESGRGRQYNLDGIAVYYSS